MVPDKKIINKIYYIRGRKVMIDHDLAELYKVKTKVLNQAVKRNAKRFPNDFMFRLNILETENLRSQIVTSSWGGIRSLPFAFTEQGVAMLSSVLNSSTAIHVNIKIIRIFIKMREVLNDHRDLLLKLNKLEKKMNKQGIYVVKHEAEIQEILKALKQLIEPPVTPRRKIGYKRSNE